MHFCESTHTILNTVQHSVGTSVCIMDYNTERMFEHHNIMFVHYLVDKSFSSGMILMLDVVVCIVYCYCLFWLMVLIASMIR